MRQTWSFFSAGQLIFGWGAANEVGRYAQQRKLSRVFLVTDPNLKQAGIVETIRQALADSQMTVEVFDEGEAEPSLDVAVRAAEQAKAFNADAIVGLGGGSNMDLAKITAVLATHGGDPKDYFSFDNVPGPVIPLICIPTTAGTGSEVSHAAVLTDKANAIKVSTLSRHLRPASCDRGSRADNVLPAKRDRRKRHRRFNARGRGLHVDVVSRNALCRRRAMRIRRRRTARRCACRASDSTDRPTSANRRL